MGIIKLSKFKWNFELIKDMFSLSPIDMQYNHDKHDNGDLHSGGLAEI